MRKLKRVGAIGLVLILVMSAYVAGSTIVVAEDSSGSIENEEIAFTDIEGHWAEDVIVKMFNMGYIKGKSATEFKPNDIITKAELITLLNRVFSLDEQKELQNDHGKWYQGELAKANYYNNYADIGAGGFDEPINRLDTVKIMEELLHTRPTIEMFGDFINPFNDQDDLDFYDQLLLSYFREYDYIDGDNNNNFNPYNNLTRAETLKLLDNILENEHVMLISEDNMVYENETLDYLLVSPGVKNITFTGCDIDKLIISSQGKSTISECTIGECKHYPVYDYGGRLEILEWTTINDFYTDDALFVFVDSISSTTYDVMEYTHFPSKPDSRYQYVNEEWVESSEGTHIGIFTVEDLISIETWGMDESYVLMNDLDISNSSSYEEADTMAFGNRNRDDTQQGLIGELTGDIDGIKIGFTPIGMNNGLEEDCIFNGTFEGNGHTITNVYFNIYNNINDIYAGLFYQIGEAGIIKDLNLSKLHMCVYMNQRLSTLSTDYKGGYMWCGALTGYNEGTVTACSVDGYYDLSFNGEEFYATRIEFGGLAGGNQGLIEECILDLDLNFFGQERAGDSMDSKLTRVGGVCGYSYGRINDCHTNGTIYGDDEVIYVGGITGQALGEIKDSTSSCSIYYPVDSLYSTADGICPAFETDMWDEDALSGCTFSGEILDISEK